jgi:hypothetical protein
MQFDRTCDRCTRACVPPSPESDVHELDTSDCLMRPLTACSGAFKTHQDAFDELLLQLVPEREGALSELDETKLQVEVEDGCVTRFYTPVASSLTQLAQALSPVLSTSRFACAQPLQCGRIVGTIPLFP